MFELITQIYKDVSIQDVKDYNNKEWEVSDVIQNTIFVILSLKYLEQID